LIPVKPSGKRVEIGYSGPSGKECWEKVGEHWETKLWEPTNKHQLEGRGGVLRPPKKDQKRL